MSGHRGSDLDADDAMGDAGMPAFSIIVPTYNEAQDIVETVQAALAQSLPPSEVIIVDGGSRDSTLAALAPFAARGDVRIIEEGERRGVAAARNTGLRAACGDVIVLLNADVILPADFLSRLCVLYREGAGMVSVESRVRNQDATTGRYLDAVHRLRYGAGRVGWSEGFSCLREAALAAAFPEEIPGAGGEDVEFVARLQAQGLRWVVDYSIVVEHRVPASLRGFWAQMNGRGRAVPYIEHAVRQRPLPAVTLRRLAAWGWSGALALALLPNTLLAARLALRSPRGLRDLPSFWLAQHVLTLASRAGEYASLRELWRARRRAAPA